MSRRFWFLRVRLWAVSIVLFVGGFVGRLVVDAQGDVAYSYQYAVDLQCCAYGAGLYLLGMWAVLAVWRDRWTTGCAIWIVVAFASAIAVLSSVPK